MSRRFSFDDHWDSKTDKLWVSLGESQFMRYQRPGAYETQRDYLDSTPSLTFNFRYMSAGMDIEYFDKKERRSSLLRRYAPSKGCCASFNELCRASYRRNIKCEWEQEQETTQWQSTTNDLKAGQANKKHGGLLRQTRTNANRGYIYLAGNA